MSQTIKFQCHIQVSNKELVGEELTFMGVSKTIGDDGKVVFDCELQEKDKNKSFPISIGKEGYIIVGTGSCNAIAHKDSTNPFCLTFNKDNGASIKDVRIYKEQIEIYTAQVEKQEHSSTQESSTNTSQTPSQENQNLVTLEAYLTSGKAPNTINWAYYIKNKGQELYPQNKLGDKNILSSLMSEQGNTQTQPELNTQITIDLNQKFTHINIQKDKSIQQTQDYLKEKQQLVIFAYKNNPAYNVGEKTTHAILTISTLPIVELSYNTLTLLYKNTHKAFQIDNDIMPYLMQDFTEDTQYELGFNKSQDYLILKTNNKLYKIYKENLNNATQSPLENTQENNPTQSTQNTSNTTNTQQNNIDSIYLKENTAFEEIKTILELTQKEQYQSVNVWVEVKLSRWDKIKIAYQRIDNLGKSEQAPIKKACPKYELVGGALYDRFKKASDIYENTCALRMSYALNYGGIPITKPIAEGTKFYTGGDNKLYVLGSQDIRDFLLKKLKYQKYTMKSKQENKSFYYNKLSHFDKNGIVVMIIGGWSNAYGHTTLWDGKEKKFVDDSNYLLDEGDIIVKEFYFWEL